MVNPRPVIRAAGIEKSYRAGGHVTPVLRGVDLAVAPGECLFLVGPSGSGKSTLLSILGCILTADAGELEILGCNVGRFTPREQARFRREKIGFVFQRFHLFEALTAAENVRVPFDLLGWPKPPSKTRVNELLELVGLAECANSRIAHLSQGQRQRVAFARALAGHPELLLADEPTSSLDAEAGLSAMRALRAMCRDLGLAVVVVTHDARIHAMADRVLRLADGRIAGQAPSVPEALPPHATHQPA